MKKMLIFISLLVAILVSGCGGGSSLSKEASAVKELQKTIDSNLKIMENSTNAVDSARQLFSNIYNLFSAIHEVDDQLAAESNKLNEKLKLAKTQAVLGLINTGNKNIFDMPKSGNKAQKEIEAVAEEIKKFNEKHREYYATAGKFHESIHQVLEALEDKYPNYDIRSDFAETAIRMSRENNFAKVDFSKIDTGIYIAPIQYNAVKNDDLNNSSTSFNHQNAIEYLIIGEAVQMRTGPGTNYDSIGVFRKAERVRLASIKKPTKSTWVKVQRANGQIGWVFGKFLI